MVYTRHVSSMTSSLMGHNYNNNQTTRHVLISLPMTDENYLWHTQMLFFWAVGGCFVEIDTIVREVETGFDVHPRLHVHI
jgi:hypothetical protein